MTIKKTKQVSITFFVALGIGLSVFFQNCSDIHLSAVSESIDSTDCIPLNLKIDQDSPLPATTRFFVSDENDQMIAQSFLWSVDGVSVSHVGSDFVLTTTSLVDCQTYVVHARYQDCSQDQNLRFEYTKSGVSCVTPTPTPTITPAPTPVALGCPNMIQTPTGQMRSLRSVDDVSWGTGLVNFNVDVTEWNNLFGRQYLGSGQLPTPLAWPGVGGSRPNLKFERNKYFGMHFRTPNSTTFAGSFSHASDSRGPALIMAISQACGDFSQNLPTPGCLMSGGSNWAGVPSSDANLVSWKFTSNNPTGSCNLQPNTDYYLNIMFADTNLDPTADNCSAGQSLCYATIVSYHN